MALSGALAGLAGGLLILGTEHRYPGVFRTGYGFDGIAVALIGGATAPGVVAAGFVFGAVRAGGPGRRRSGSLRAFPGRSRGLRGCPSPPPEFFARPPHGLAPPSGPPAA